MNKRFLFILIFLLTIGFVRLSARVLSISWEKRDTLLEGKEYGKYGAYELLSGWVTFGLDPANPFNQQVVDLGLAPRNEEGLVEARARLVVLQPIDPDRRRGVALVEVSNRGGKFSLNYFNRAGSREMDPKDSESWGDGLLMRQGFTVVWVGWQWDVPREEGRLFLEAPIATQMDGSPVTGWVRSDWVVDEPVSTLEIGHRGQVPYPPLDPESHSHSLTWRAGREAARQVVPRAQWRFARIENGQWLPDSSRISLEDGFVPGRIYELVYQAKDPRVVGMSLAAIRDMMSYVKYNSACIFPAKQGIAAGVSQTGRFLRQFLYQGFNTDEAGRKAFDGMMVITAGAGRGSFNHRFAQPSRDGHAYSAFFYPTDIFPFTSQTTFDSLQNRSDGLYAHAVSSDHIPKIFFINTGYEYWGRAAALIHISPDGLRDIDPPPNERIYHLASGQHYVDRFPPSKSQALQSGIGYQGNPLEYKVNYRALLIRLLEWVEEKQMPPPSAYPRITDGTLLSMEEWTFPDIHGLALPVIPQVAYRVDYGPRWCEGIIDLQPPRTGPAFPARVPKVDSLGNELGGIRNLELRVPLATFTPWSLRTGLPGDSTALDDFRGMVIPFSDKKKILTDPRTPPHFKGYTDYSHKVEEALSDLIREGWVLPEDRDYLSECSKGYWDWLKRN